jgi:hypothetical protein
MADMEEIDPRTKQSQITLLHREQSKLDYVITR